MNICTDYGLDGPGSNSGGGEIFRPSRPALGHTQPPVKWVPGLSCEQSAAGACCWPLTPFYCRGHGRVELYLYPRSGPHRARNGITLPLYICIYKFLRSRTKLICIAVTLCSIAGFWTKFPRCSDGHLKYFTVFWNVDVFRPQCFSRNPYRCHSDACLRNTELDYALQVTS